MNKSKMAFQQMKIKIVSNSTYRVVQKLGTFLVRFITSSNIDQYYIFTLSQSGKNWINTITEDPTTSHMHRHYREMSMS